jgi:hypothetical protein
VLPALQGQTFALLTAAGIADGHADLAALSSNLAQLFGWICFLVGIEVAASASQIYLGVRWRRRLTVRLQSDYLSRRAFYHLARRAPLLDNPDQRITSDLDQCLRSICGEYVAAPSRRAWAHPQAPALHLARALLAARTPRPECFLFGSPPPRYPAQLQHCLTRPLPVSLSATPPPDSPSPLVILSATPQPGVAWFCLLPRALRLRCLLPPRASWPRVCTPPWSCAGTSRSCSG